MKQVVIAGCGDVGTALGERLVARGWKVFGLRRNTSDLPDSIQPIAADLTQPDKPGDWPDKVDYLVYCPAAGKRDPELYRKLYVEGLEHVLAWARSGRKKPQFLLQVSSTGVYGQSGGEWVTENSPALAESPTARILVEAEDVALRGGIPSAVVRLAGIYGPGRNRLIEQVRAGLCVPSEPAQYTNRIHRDDAAALLEHLLHQADQDELLAPCYLGVDDEPAPMHEVAGWLAEQLGVKLLEEGPTSGRTGSKRCSNALARETGWEPQYPSYREGYGRMLKEA
ncbi:SDR family oxidoreductase [Pseudomonas sp. gcc21]|uniref:SDR family oxidoreductase n=1 Tax=Pseudomonas sp. gcc21 TaxID=2726989 RepID=UPI001451A650|nr:SDR family oxidoreductase [Pseudomonas sp. gcc21]QJD59663.1 SDR family oxidoreductase [Pseudomonas sp. gcc21]